MTGKPGDKLENVIRANVLEGVERLKGLDPILAKLAKTGELKVVGALLRAAHRRGRGLRLNSAR